MSGKLFYILLPLMVVSLIRRPFISTSNGYEKYKKVADSIFLARQSLPSFSFQRIYEDADLDKPRIAVVIGNIFTAEDKNAIEIYSTSDSTADLNLFQYQDLKWSLVQKQSIGYGSTGAADKFIFLVNINDDNIKDLLILTAIWEMRVGENLKAFLFRKNKLVEVKGFEDYPNPEYDPKTKRIYSYMGTGCADMTMEFMDGVIQNDSLVTKRDIDCDCCRDDGSRKCEISINNRKPFKVAYDSCYKYVQPFYQGFLKRKLRMNKDN